MSMKVIDAKPEKQFFLMLLRLFQKAVEHLFFPKSLPSPLVPTIGPTLAASRLAVHIQLVGWRPEQTTTMGEIRKPLSVSNFNSTLILKRDG
ncbi:hypothetical protein [Mesorhizobium amorphae]|uniref:Uncharacterized protein n=1 Tax=Mesorhizobium amorphae CCNWGS0123 TaxID=1082933 RepID=G6YK16_9HYPH|nr:hypothetical protein [Mesorhizobium amorphae]ANT54596.1 hypothetical protein A6B35_31865 [Mesorhizobium amorphae CCNWGS0123]EHH04188.1 hypothetical protein MEA186_31751 [Mesorhizobium amorphae CCNWGS0123]